MSFVSLDTNFSELQKTEGDHLTELSKILFPQSISAEGQGVSIAPCTPDFDGRIDKSFVATQFLSKLIIQNNISTYKDAKSLMLSFRSEDIIFPFHNFW